MNKQLQDRAVQLTFEGRSGFLRSALEALQIPVDSQLLVFSRTSLQAKRINEGNPRALFFNDRVALGWVRDRDVLEVAARDESQGIVSTRSNSAQQRLTAHICASGTRARQRQRLQQGRRIDDARGSDRQGKCPEPRAV